MEKESPLHLHYSPTRLIRTRTAPISERGFVGSAERADVGRAEQTREQRHRDGACESGDRPGRVRATIHALSTAAATIHETVKANELLRAGLDAKNFAK